jgi:hypothetical protein
MPNLKLQTSRALSVIPSDNTNIPMPSVIVSGITTSTVTDKLVDSTKNFISLGVQIGDIVYNTTGSLAATVTNVDSATQLSLNDDIIVSSEKYKLYSGTNISGSIEPCVLYVGVGGDLEVTTAGGDLVTFMGILSGTFLPIHVIKVNTGTTATDIIALW